MERAAIERDVRSFLVDEFFRGDKFSILDSRSCLTGSIEIDAALYGEAAERSKRCIQVWTSRRAKLLRSSRVGTNRHSGTAENGGAFQAFTSRAISHGYRANRCTGRFSVDRGMPVHEALNAFSKIEDSAR
jgi:hypothetical protein